jgi:hypothetical protein
MAILAHLANLLFDRQSQSHWFNHRGARVPNITHALCCELVQRKWKRIRTHWTPTVPQVVQDEDGQYRREAPDEIRERMGTQAKESTARGRRMGRVQRVRVCDSIVSLTLTGHSRSTEDASGFAKHDCVSPIPRGLVRRGLICLT